MPYIIMTDSHTDLPYTLVDEWQLPLVLMPYSLNGEEHLADMGRNDDYKTIFAALRSGINATTSQLPEAAYTEYLEPHLMAGNDVLFISFSSQLSKTIDNLRASAQALMERYPERRIEIFDTLAISMTQGLLVMQAVKLRAEGADMDEVLAWLRDNHQRAHGAFMVDDLGHLKRGGRLSGSAALLGTILDIKPFLVISKEGRIVPCDKVKGHRRGLRRLVQYVQDNIVDPENSTVAIMHSESLEDADLLESMLREALPVGEVMKLPVGSVIGVHAGPGLIAVCFMGKPRSI